MLEVIMSLKKKLSCEKLRDNAAYRPYVGKFVPLTTFQDDFRWAILSSANNWAVELIVLCRPTKINDSNFIWFRNVYFLILVLEALDDKKILFEQDILWFQVSMCVSNFVQKPNWMKNLFKKWLNQFHWKSTIIVHFDNFIERFSQWLEN